MYDAWLKAGGEPEPIRASLVGWFKAAASRQERGASCARRGCTATGEPALVRDAIGVWLAEHGGAAPGVTYVYEAWLQAGGDPELVREPIRDWLAVNATKRSASFVLQGWLDSGGDPRSSATACNAGCACTARAPAPSTCAARGPRPAADVRRAWVQRAGEAEVDRP